MMSSKGVVGELLLAERTIRHLGVIFPVDNSLLCESLLIRLARERPKVRYNTRVLPQGWIGQNLGQLGQALFQPADLEVGLVDHFPPDFLETSHMISLSTSVVVVAISTLVACFADAAPIASYGFPLS